MMPSSLWVPSRPSLDGSRSSTVLRRSTRDVETCEVLSRPPLVMALTGRSSRRLETLAESRMSLSPRFWTELTLVANSAEWVSSASSESANPDTVESMVETVSGSSLTIEAALETWAAPTAAGGCRVRSVSGASTAVGGGGVVLISLASDLLLYVRDHLLKDLIRRLVHRA